MVCDSRHERSADLDCGPAVSEFGRGISLNQNELARVEIERILGRRGNQYTHAVVRSALALDDRDQWKNCITSVYLSDGKPDDSQSLIYSGFELHVVRETPEKILGLIGSLINDGKLSVAGRAVPLQDGRFSMLGHPRQMGRHVSKSEAWFPNEWPGNQYLFEAKREEWLPSDSLVGPGMPAYPNAYSAVRHIFGVEASGGHTWDGGVYFFFPDYRARIDSVAVGAETLSIRLGLRHSTVKDLVGKIYAKSRDQAILQQDIMFGEIEQKVDLGFRAEELFFCLVSKSEGEVLDCWRYPSFAGPSKPNIEVYTAENVQQLAKHGEDGYLEYKPGVMKDERARKEIAESAIALSNTDGGIILMGVNDNAQIEGAFGDGLADSIAQVLRDRCEPPITPVIRSVVVEDKPVYVILIPKSTNKPHLLKATGTVYVRVSSTDRPATRHELEELFRQRT